MTPDQIRLKVLEVYPSQKWTDKVSKMSDAQVYAIFRRLSAQGKIK